METETRPPLVGAAKLASREKRMRIHVVVPFPPLELETRPTVSTATAAYYLNRKPQTLRIWALTGHPIVPRRVNGRLAWSTDAIRKLLGVVA